MKKTGKKWLAAVLAASLAIGGISIPAEAEVDPDAITQEDFLKAEGKNIYTRSGELIQLRGSNAGGLSGTGAVDVHPAGDRRDRGGNG